MSYTKQSWGDNDTTKPLSAARLGAMEQGIADAHSSVALRGLNPREYSNAAGNGTTDDSAAFQATLTAAAAAGTDVIISAGTYRLLSTIDVPAGTTVRALPGVTIDVSGLGVAPAFQAIGTAAAAVTLGADALEGSLSVTVTSAAGIVAGDWVKIGSSAISTNVTSQPIGEIQRVRSMSSNTLTFADPISRSYLVADSASVQELTQRTDITFEGLHFRGDPAQITVRYQAIRFDTCRNVAVRNCVFKWIHYISIALVDTVEARVSGCHFEDALEAGSAYGVANHWATQDVSVVNCTSLRVRHQVTCGGGTTRRGTPRRVTVSACTATESIDAGFDAHSGCDWYTVVGCHVIGGGQDGIIGQGRVMTFTGNTVVGVVRHGIFVQATSIGGVNCEITGNNVSRVGGRGILVVGDGASTIHRLWSGGTVTGNNVSDIGQTGIELQNLDTSTTAEGFTLAGNSARRCANYGILVRGCSDAAITGNHVYSTPSTFAALYLLTSTDCTVVGNTINGSSTSQSGIRLGTSSTNCIVTSNRVRNCTTGVTQDSSSGPAIVSTNNTISCTTGYTLSASGNVNVNNL